MTFVCVRVSCMITRCPKPIEERSGRGGTQSSIVTERSFSCNMATHALFNNLFRERGTPAPLEVTLVESNVQHGCISVFFPPRIFLSRFVDHVCQINCSMYLLDNTKLQNANAAHVYFFMRCKHVLRAGRVSAAGNCSRAHIRRNIALQYTGLSYHLID